MRRVVQAALSLIAFSLAIPPVTRADLIPYPNSGHYNSVTYSFIAAQTGDVTAYFAGSDASYDNQIGLLVNGVLTSAGYGLDDHTSSIGQPFDFGHVNAGDSLVFDLNVLTLGAQVYSDPSRNVAFDVAGETVGHNHIYATTYSAMPAVFGKTPPGMYVAFEDEGFPYSDYSYADENFVFTNVAFAASVPEPASIISTGLGCLGSFTLIRRRGRAA